MVDFADKVRETAAEAYRAWAESASLSEDEKRKKFGRAVRVSARYLPDLRKEVRSGDTVWYSDAPKVVGGKGERPGALAHFIAGLPLCQLTHYSERASVGGLKIEDLEISAVGRFVGMPGHGFDQIEYEVRITSSEPAEKIKALASASAGDCYVTNTLKRSSEVMGKVMLNGQLLAEL
jgi:uncharacterized OsmC-like protein